MTVDPEIIRFIYSNPIIEEIHIESIRIIKKYFGNDIQIKYELTYNDNYDKYLIMWIQYPYDNTDKCMDNGLFRYQDITNWWIDNDYDLKTDQISINIQFVDTK